jgi:hypothetical protein
MVGLVCSAACLGVGPAAGRQDCAYRAVIAAVKAFVSWFFYDELADAIAERIKDHFGEGVDEAYDIFMNHPQQCLRLSLQWFPWATLSKKM